MPQCRFPASGLQECGLTALFSVPTVDLVLLDAQRNLRLMQGLSRTAAAALAG